MICGVKSRTSNCVLDRKDDKYGVWERLLTEWTTLLTWELIWPQLLLSPPFNLNFNINPVCHKSPFSIIQREKLKVEALDMRKQSHRAKGMCVQLKLYVLWIWVWLPSVALLLKLYYILASLSICCFIAAFFVSSNGANSWTRQGWPHLAQTWGNVKKCKRFGAFFVRKVQILVWRIS